MPDLPVQLGSDRLGPGRSRTVATNAVLLPLLRCFRLDVPGRSWLLAPPVQAAGGDQRADREQQQAEGQVDARADCFLGADGVEVEDEHVQRADRDPHGEAAEQDTQERRRFSISSRSMASSLGFSAAASASTKNSAFIAGQPVSGIVAAGEPSRPG